MALSPKNRTGMPGNTADKGRKTLPPKASGSRTFRLADQVSRWIALVFVFICTVLLVTPSLFHEPAKYPPRITAPEDIPASISFSVPDEEEMSRLEQEKQNQAPYFFTHEKETMDSALKKLDDLFARAQSLVLSSANLSTETLNASLVDYAQSKLGLPMDQETASRTLFYANDKNFQDITKATIRHLYEERGIIDNYSRYRSYDRSERVKILTKPRKRPEKAIVMKNLLEPSQIQEYLESDYFTQQRFYSTLPPEQVSLLTYLTVELAKPYNIRYDPDATREYLAEEMAEVKRHPPMKQYHKGMILVEKDQPIDRALLERMDEAYARTLYRRLLGTSLYIALLFVVVFYYIRLFKPDMAFTTRNVLLVASPVLLALAAGRGGFFVLMQTAEYRDAAGYLIPVGLVGMLTVILLDVRLGILLVTVTSLAFSVTTGLDFKAFLMALLGGYAGVAALTSVKERKDVLWAGLFVGSINALVILLANFIDDPTVLQGNAMFWGFGNGLVCGVLTLPVLAVFESVFGVVTDIRLLEITGLNHPMLQQLEEKAPGTYQHSLGVVKLSEAAAKAIGANFLLVRAGALFHDIGKILKPKYFGENQVSLDEKSLHSKLSPYMSAMVIKNHVKAGIDLARQYRLPERVIDFIPEHQGTTLILWPYHEAKKRFQNSESMDPVREEDFRYPGPKPQSIETAIVMLADSVEATATSRFTSLSVNEDELRHTVQKTISDKFNDEQFDECDLTLRDLHLIRESFVKTLLSRFHSRIAYPAAPAQSGPAGPSPKRDRIERVG